MADIRKTFRAWLVEGEDRAMRNVDPPMAMPPLVPELPPIWTLSAERRERVRQATVRETWCNDYMLFHMVSRRPHDEFEALQQRLHEGSWHL